MGDAQEEARGPLPGCWKCFLIGAVVTGMCSLRENVTNSVFMMYVLFYVQNICQNPEAPFVFSLFSLNGQQMDKSSKEEATEDVFPFSRRSWPINPV